MQDNHSRLWQGGPWERPGSGVPPAVPFRTRKPKKAGRAGRRKERKKRRGWLWFGVGMTVIAVLIGTAALLSQTDWSRWLPSTPPALSGGGNGSGAETTPPPFDRNTVKNQPTTIPRAPAGGAAEMVLHPADGETLSLQEIYDRNIASIVYIQVIRKNGYGLGSGVILSSDGYIITNEHMIAGASSCQVVLHDERVLDAELVGYHSGYDLAVLKVAADDLQPAQFGNSAALRVGDSVAAIGNPLSSNLRGTMTEGIVSAINRSVTLGGTDMSLIQTSAALNMGNSGGALINDRGQVVGITTMKMMSDYSTVEGLGFAIPSRFAKSIVDQIVATGVAKMPALGITVWSDVASYGGQLIKEVHEKSDAWAKGLRPGDIILEAEGVAIVDNDTLAFVKETMRVGDEMLLRVKRGEEEFEVRVKLVDSELVS